MCNELDQQVRQVTKGPSEALTRWAQVYAATLAVRRASSPPNVFARWRSTQKKSFSWQITPSMIWRLPAAQRRSAFCHALLESSYGVAATRAPYSSSQRRSHSTPVNPLSARLRFVTVAGHEGVCYGPLVGGGRGQPEGGDDAPRIDHQGHLEAVDPFGLGGAPAEGGLPAEEPLAGSPHPHDGRDEGRVHHVVDGRRIGEFLGEGPLQGAQLGLQGSYPAVELALGAELREVLAQVRPSEAPEVPLASEARPLGQDRQGDDLRVREQGRTTRAARGPTVADLPPIVH